MIVEDFTDRAIIVKELSLLSSLNDEGTYNGKYWCSAFLIEWVKVDISFFRTSDFLEYTEHLYDSIEQYKKHVSRIKHKVIDAKIVYDPLHMLEKAQSLVGVYPPWFKNQLITNLLGEIKHHADFIRFSGLRNRYESQFVAWDIITPACMAIYAHHDSFFMLWFKRLHHDLPTFSWAFMILIDDLLEAAYHYDPEKMVIVWDQLYKRIHELLTTQQ